jgi:hypothetical protein
MPKIKKILCIGNNTIDTDDYCQKLSAEYNIKYQGLLSNINLTINGCYHTSIADLTDSKLLSISNCFDKIIFLDNYQHNSVLKDTSEMMKNIITNNDTSFKSFSSDNVIFFGCSHTAGVGFSDKTKTFPWLISKLQNKVPLIDGCPGRGNYLIDDKLNEYSLKNKCVIVQFTDIFRIRYLDSYTNTVTHKRGRDYSKEEIAMFDEPRLAWEFERIVDRTVARLRDADANFLFFQLTHQNNLDQKTKLYMSKYKEFCYMPSDMFVDFAEDLIHCGPLTHHNIATNLLDKWNLLYAKN